MGFDSDLEIYGLNPDDFKDLKWEDEHVEVFINMEDWDMTIKIEDGIDDLTAISLVKQVIEQGKISNNGNSYCYLTLFGDICVETRQYRKSPCFRVYKKNELWLNKKYLKN